MIDIYTCITAGYDDLKKHPRFPNTRYTAYVEGVQRPLPPWVVKPVVTEPGTDPTRSARERKVLAHEALSEAKVSLWVDGCFVIRPDLPLAKWIQDYLGDHDLATFEHASHQCTYEHAEHVIKAGLDNAVTVAAQMLRYKSAGFPTGHGMVQTSVVIRRHTPAVQKFNETWWRHIQAGSRRDQLSFVVASAETGVKYRAIPASERRFFEGKSHRGKRTNP